MEEGERAPPPGQVGERHLVFGSVEIGLEIVNPKFVEFAEDNVTRTVGDKADPIIEGLAPSAFPQVAAARSGGNLLE